MAVQLVHLPEVERLGPACIRILGGNPGKMALQGTNTYLLGTGPERLLIDSGQGIPSWIEAIKRTLQEENARVSKAIITHWHGDHTGGIAHLLQLSPDTKVYKNQPTDPVQLDIADGQRFTVEGASLTAVHTPGHTTDHMVLIWEEEDAMFTGDNVLGHGTAVFEDLGTYLGSLAKMDRLFKGKAYPGHGPVLADGPGKIAEYIRHRHQREDQVVQTLRIEKKKPKEASPAGIKNNDGCWTPMELVKVIYEAVPESLHEMAAHGVIQILKKLQDEGRAAVVDGNRWRLITQDRSAL
ncbi:metallo-beta-lactamase superfamily protein [Apodospora peruviana]|uniref:Metallo-beta-lactamase superfamily protein n=1 Tax=Apodospora peruviana TaxID=516989 RepID=A0AAE0HW18_9PEZI|nr:metallo-beta-lactamase superfamily protein [Apodospora peruviana]